MLSNSETRNVRYISLSRVITVLEIYFADLQFISLISALGSFFSFNSLNMYFYFYFYFFRMNMYFYLFNPV